MGRGFSMFLALLLALFPLNLPAVSVPALPREDLGYALRWMWYQMDAPDLQSYRASMDHVHLLYDIPSQGEKPRLVAYLYHVESDKSWMRSWVEVNDRDKLYPMSNAIAYLRDPSGGLKNQPDGRLKAEQLLIGGRAVQCLATVSLAHVGSDKRRPTTFHLSDLYGTMDVEPSMVAGAKEPAVAVTRVP